MKVHHTSSRAGIAHLLPILLVVVAVVGILGFGVYNVMQKDQTNASGTNSSQNTIISAVNQDRPATFEYDDRGVCKLYGDVQLKYRYTVKQGHTSYIDAFFKGNLKKSIELKTSMQGLNYFSFESPDKDSAFRLEYRSVDNKSGTKTSTVIANGFVNKLQRCGPRLDMSEFNYHGSYFCRLNNEIVLSYKQTAYTLADYRKDPTRLVVSFDGKREKVINASKQSRGWHYFRFQIDGNDRVKMTMAYQNKQDLLETRKIASLGNCLD